MYLSNSDAGEDTKQMPDQDRIGVWSVSNSTHMQLAHILVNYLALKKGLNDLRWVRVRRIAIA